MKKKYTMTLLEIMIVIFIIGIISSVIGYNMKGSLEKGRAFKTKEGINKLYEIVQLEEAGGKALNLEKDLGDSVAELLKHSGLVRNPKDLMKDGWGNPYHFSYENMELRITSKKYEDYCSAKNIEEIYPWSDKEDSHS